MSTKKLLVPSKISPTLCIVLCLILFLHVTASENQDVPGHLVKRDERQSIISTEFGEVLGANVYDGNETFRLQFITLEPNSLFLPVLLHQDMVFYVHTGSGKLMSYRDEYKKENVSLKQGDVYRLETGTVFFLQSDLELDLARQKFRICAIFGNAGEALRQPTAYGPYSSIRDLVLGFDKKILKETFKVPSEVMEEITSEMKPEAIMHGLPRITKRSISAYSSFDTINKDKKKSNLFNIFHEKRDFKNCNGWSTTVNQKKYSAFKDSKYGLFMVNLTNGGMMGPHWNPMATEISIVLHGKGMVRIICPSLPNQQTECKNTRFEVEEGDVFVVPRFHPVVQMAFNNETFVFMGFATSTKNNHPQYLAGKVSVLRALDKHILAASFGVNDTTFDKLLNKQGL
ncbi:hypothetical protein ACH5RR_007044 [Cinchona calisaya]|uniref:Cupin type-1 domain-containing protein n=1 Tax=Cinchona calisaya TaxID=153742 RepID=A0ABD3AR12_9GENT